MFHWAEVDTVLLDMDGTLLDLHFDNYFWHTFLPKRYAEFHGIDLAAAHLELNSLMHVSQGQLKWYCLDHWSQQVGMDIPTLKREVQHKIQSRPHTETFLQFLKDQNKRVILATNAHPKGLSLKLELSRLDRWLDVVVSSHDLGAPKEQQAFWHALQSIENFNPARTLFVDDNLDVLKSAQTFGLRWLMYIRQPDLQQPPREAEGYIDIIDFDEVMPEIHLNSPTRLHE